MLLNASLEDRRENTRSQEDVIQFYLNRILSKIVNTVIEMNILWDNSILYLIYPFWSCKHVFMVNILMVAMATRIEI